ncbi:Relaxase/Mobilisation nuclease domain-containing protein [Trichlorobacter thiogenes]|uniref:Relaxase/Mobilisation nuclease domain-containing protein n=1 Tax=Trichlorobacter thiogenes TaxID=115783 RepID=A0A1T4M5V2_9BACT|nr:Relaxase/Mobilisation nuclease domain-containing protein [Trichlorobacter thiogenes]
MKSKITRGRDFSGLCRYILRHSAQPDLIGGNLAGAGAADLASEFVQVANLRPDIEKPVWHSSLALPKGDTLTDQEWNKIVRDYLEDLGFDPLTTPYVVVRHKNTGSDHVHISASRVNLSGGLYLGQNEHLIATRICQKLERKHGLTTTLGPDHKAPAKALKTQEKAMQQRTGKVPPRRCLQHSIDNIINNSINLTTEDFIKKLAKVDITAKPNLSRSGKMSGFSFEINGITFKASQLGKSYGWQALEKRLQQSQQVKSLPLTTTSPKPAREVARSIKQPVTTPHPANATTVVTTAAAELTTGLLDDQDVNKIASLICGLTKEGIGLPLPSPPSTQQTKIPNVEQLHVSYSPPKPAFMAIRDEKDKAKVTDNKTEIKRLSSELWLGKKKTKRRQGIIIRIINWRRKQILTKEIERLKRRNADLRAKAEAQITAPQAPTTRQQYDQIIVDFCKLQISKDTTLQQLNANQKAYELALQQTGTKLTALQNRRAEVLKLGKEQGWEPHTPPPPIWQPLTRNKHATWKNDLNHASSELVKLQNFEIHQKRYLEQIQQASKARQIEVWSNARREVEPRPQMIKFIHENKTEKGSNISTKSLRTDQPVADKDTAEIRQRPARSPAGSGQGRPPHQGWNHGI